MTTFLICHGAWSAGWAWKKMRPLLRAAGHEIFTPTYTGVGERAHLANPSIDLETHIRDIVAVLECEDLKDVALVGHSYGGMVATGVADRARARIAKLIYVDAFAPRNGESLFDLAAPDRRDAQVAAARKEGDGWRIPVGPMPPDTPEADIAWAMPRRQPQPLRTFEQRLELTSTAEPPARAYIYCKRARPGDGFRPSYERAKAGGWMTFEIDASHNPHITAPQELAEFFERIVR
jgi:pimeloyl-ACP methyl ester carboxylesterase